MGARCDARVGCIPDSVISVSKRSNRTAVIIEPRPRAADQGATMLVDGVGGRRKLCSAFLATQFSERPHPDAGVHMCGRVTTTLGRGASGPTLAKMLGVGRRRTSGTRAGSAR